VRNNGGRRRSDKIASIIDPSKNSVT